MASSSIDTLLNIAAPPRAGDRSARSRDADSFDPALRQAMAEERPKATVATATAPPAPPAKDEKAEPGEAPEDSLGAVSDQEGQQASEIEAAAQDADDQPGR